VNRLYARRVAYGLGVASIGALVAYVLSQDDLLSALGEVSLLDLVAMVAASILAAALQGWQFNTLARMFDLDLDTPEWFGLTIGNTMVNYLVPARAGLVVRAAYLKRVHSLSVTAYAALTALLLLMSVSVASILGLLGFALHRSASGSSAASLGLVFVATLVISLSLVLLMPHALRLSPRMARLRDRADAFRSGLLTWRRNPRLATTFVATTALWILAQATRLWIAFRSVGVELSFAGVLMIQALVGVAFVVSLTPGNLGVKEGAIAFAAAALGIGSQLGLLVGLVDRAVAFGVVMTLGPAFAHHLLKRSNLRTRGAGSNE
jgi:uncharacterized protein (TIRG00374 family)